MNNDEKYMNLALQQAKKAYMEGEVPVGVVIVKDNQVIAETHNFREQSNKATGHAEILAIEEANSKLDSWRLDSCTLYVTIEPCPMCAGAIIQSRISRIVYGAADPKAGAHKSVTNLFDIKFNHKVQVDSGVLEAEAKKLMTDFFQELRK